MDEHKRKKHRHVIKYSDEDIKAHGGLKNLKRAIADARDEPKLKTK